MQAFVGYIVGVGVSVGGAIAVALWFQESEWMRRPADPLVVFARCGFLLGLMVQPLLQWPWTWAYHARSGAFIVTAICGMIWVILMVSFRAGWL